MERVDLATPITPPSITAWKVDDAHLRWGLERIHIVLKGSNGETKNVSYEGDRARTMLRILNTANLTVNSAHRRILAQLIADGEIAGTIRGAPD